MTTAPPSPSLELGPYRLVEVIGEGGMGRIWRARHTLSGAEVAIKVLSARHASDVRQRQRLVREIQAAARLEHPCIVRVLDHGVVESQRAEPGRVAADSPWLAMELCSHGSLPSQRLALRWSLVRDVLRSVLDALAYAHARRIVHRDLKPGNVLLDRADDGRLRVRLSDFGLAHAFAAEDRDDGAGIDSPSAGTPLYMAPEQFDGDWRNYGPWTDLYALGCTAWELCCGQPPFSGASYLALGVAHMRTPLPAFAPRFAPPPRLEHWLGRLLAKNPWHRFQCAADALAALEGLAPAPDDALGLATDEMAALATTGWTLGTVAATQLVAREGLTEATATALEPVGSGCTAGVASAPTGALLEPRDVAPMAPGWRAPHDPPPRPATAATSLFGLREVPFVGRQAERDALWAMLGRVRCDGQPGALLIEGTSGSGKRRLVRWLVERAHELGTATVAVRAQHSPTQAPHDGLRRMVEVHLRTLGLERDAARRQLEQVIEALAPATAGAPLRIDELLALIQPSAGGVAFASARERDLGIERVLLPWAAQRPVIVWLDDVQWSLDALGLARTLLEARPGQRPLLLVLTVRSEALEARPVEAEALARLRRHARVQALALEPFSDALQLRLVERMLALEPGLARAVAERTSGSPLLAVHMLDDLVERGLLRDDGQTRLRLDAPLQTALAPDMTALWSARLERLCAASGAPRRVRHALELAALLGPHVETALWTAACAHIGLDGDGCADLDQLLESLVGSLVERRLAERLTGGWAFTHERLCDWLVEQARHSGRSSLLHAACAEALAGQTRYAHTEVAERRAHHLIEAGRLDEAIHCLEPALASVRSLHLGHAAHLVERYGALLDQTAAPAGDPRRARAALLRVTHLLEHGDADVVEQLLERALADAERFAWPADLVAEIHLLRGSQLRYVGQLDAAVASMQRALAIHRARGDEPASDRAMRFLIDARTARGDSGGDLREQLAGLARRHEARGEHTALAGCLRQAGYLARRQGRLDDARAHITRAMQVATDAGYRTTIPDLYSALGDIERCAGNPAAAELTYRRCLEHMLDMTPVSGAVVRINLAFARIEQACFDEAEATLREVVAEPWLSTVDYVLLYAHFGLVACTAARADLAACTAELERAEQLVASTGAADPDGVTCCELAARLLEQQGAHALAARAQRLAETQRR